jgi:pteridine reductase
MKSNNEAHKTVLITGAGRRIGAALAESLHHHGYNIIIHYRHSKNEAQALCEKCCAKRPNSAVILAADLDNTNEISHLVEQAHAVWQRLDVVINNASCYIPTKVGETTEQQWLDIVKSNLMSPFFIAQAALPFLQKSHGCLINMSDTNVSHPKKNYIVYTSAKGGLNTLTHALALEFAPQVRVNTLAIGPTFWPEGKNKLSAADQEKILQKIPLQRQATADELTQTILFLIENKFITGQIVTVDGGKSL